LNEIVAESTHMLRRLISEDVKLDLRLASSVWAVRVDPLQIDQILTNLCVNARDAVSPGGTITVQTVNVKINDLPPGLAAEATHGVSGFVRLSVSDDGHGMEPDVLEHAFEPFYTTKGSGRGTGLGLATVYGIVTQNGGFVDARSQVGVGSVMNAYLPRVEGEVTRDSGAQSRDAVRSQGETVLLVEDEPAILAMAERALKSLGYAVLASGDPEGAIALAEAHRGRIDLLITDVIMPGMNGQDLAVRVKRLRPRAGCLFMSGYTADVISSDGVIPTDTHFIQKPFSVAALAAKVREVLGSGQRLG
jgi:CheY-like chemotaxis protein